MIAPQKPFEPMVTTSTTQHPTHPTCGVVTVDTGIGEIEQADLGIPGTKFFPQHPMNHTAQIPMLKMERPMYEDEPIVVREVIDPNRLKQIMKRRKKSKMARKARRKNR